MRLCISILIAVYVSVFVGCSRSRCVATQETAIGLPSIIVNAVGAVGAVGAISVPVGAVDAVYAADALSVDIQAKTIGVLASL